MASKLTVKQETFCNKYVECSNASEAYRFAYTAGKMKEDTVHRRAKELLKNGPVTARLKILQDELKAKSDITKERVLEKLSSILESKITDYVEFDGFSLWFKSFNNLTEKQIDAIESIKQGKYGMELKLHGKSWTIERICRMLGFDAPIKNEITGKDGKDLIPAVDYSKLSTEELQTFHDLKAKILAKAQ